MISATAKTEIMAHLLSFDAHFRFLLVCDSSESLLMLNAATPPALPFSRQLPCRLGMSTWISPVSFSVIACDSSPRFSDGAAASFDDGTPNSQPVATSTVTRVMLVMLQRDARNGTKQCTRTSRVHSGERTLTTERPLYLG